MATAPVDGTSEKTTPWARYRDIRRRKGLMVEWITAATGLNRTQIWGMLNGMYGQPATPEKRAALIRALNEGPGDPVAESDIWGDPDPEPESA